LALLTAKVWLKKIVKSMVLSSRIFLNVLNGKLIVINNL
jgi:hypothetical protein